MARLSILKLIITCLSNRIMKPFTLSMKKPIHVGQRPKGIDLPTIEVLKITYTILGGSLL